jgi:hypothetical protein
MTIVMAAKYDRGVMYCSDMAAYDVDTDQRSMMMKVKKAPNTPIVRAVSGTIDNENWLLDDITKYYNDGKREPVQTVLKTLNACGIGSWKTNYEWIRSGFKFKSIKYLGNSYIFSFSDGKDVRMYKANPLERQMVMMDFAMIGSGSCEALKSFMEKSYVPNMDEIHLKDVLNSALEISFLEQKKSNPKRHLLGKGMAKHTANGLEQMVIDPYYNVIKITK